MKSAIAAGFLIGFIVGLVAGFMYGKKTKSRIGESVSTSFSHGVLTVKADTLKAIGVRDYFK